MNRVASQTEIGKICSEQSPCSASRLSRPADTLSGALSHGQDPLPKSRGRSLHSATVSAYDHRVRRRRDAMGIDRDGDDLPADRWLIAAVA